MTEVRSAAESAGAQRPNGATKQATRELRIQLAQARARLVLLKRLAALSTITIDLSQTPQSRRAGPVTGGFLNGLKGTTHDALQSLLLGGALWPGIWLLAYAEIRSAGGRMRWDPQAADGLGSGLLAYAPIWVPLLLVGRYAPAMSTESGRLLCRGRACPCPFWRSACYAFRV